MKKRNRVMVCVTRQRHCERLIRLGREIADKEQGELFVVHVARIGESFLGNPDEGKALDYLFSISKDVGADMTVLRSENIVDTLVNFAKETEITAMVLGQPPDKRNDNIVRRLERRLADVEFRIVPG
ncbi:MAG TPA: universal stress protein UspA [Clostridiales bacterium]|nr:universal stress protein UspA [Clostridiales bacterium]